MGDKLMRNDTGQAIVTLLREFLNTQQSALESKIGTLSSLTTTAKASLVAAINELVANRGALNGLSTTAKSTIVAAINELVGVDSGHNTRISSLEDRVGRNNVGAHNSIYRGKNLGVFTEAHSTAIRNGTFEDMYVGDWFTCPSAYKNTIWGDTAFLIAGFNLFYRSDYANHVVLISSRYDDQHALNKSWIDTSKIAYAKCNWRTEYKPEYEEAAGHIFLDESHLVMHREILSTAHNGRIITESVGDNGCCCEILDLANITGFMTLEHTASSGNAGNDRAFPNGGIFPLFALNRRALKIYPATFTRTRTFEANNIIYCWSAEATIHTNTDNSYGISTNPYITIK